MFKSFKRCLSLILSLFPCSVFSTSNNESGSLHMGNDRNQLLQFYTAEGEQIHIEREEYRTKVLPYNLKENWNNPDELFNTIRAALGDNFSEDVVEASKRLLEIDPNHERGYATYSTVLINNQKKEEARKLLEDYIQKYGNTSTILTNLALTHKNPEDAERLVWTALQMDPNNDVTLRLWLVSQNEKKGREGYKKGLTEASKIQGAWRPQIYQFIDYLESHDLKAALSLIDHIVKTAPIESGALADLSGYLGQNGYSDQVLKLILPHYTAERGNLLGLVNNILHAFYELKKPEEALAFVKKEKQHPQNADIVESVSAFQLNQLLEEYQDQFVQMLKQ